MNIARRLVTPKDMSIYSKKMFEIVDLITRTQVAFGV